MIRKPCVAGRFYPEARAELARYVEGFMKDALREKVVAAIAPHAGYMYSGSVAGAVYSSIEIPDSVILIGPNHTGLGAKASVMSSGVWETPVGGVKVDEATANELLAASRLFSDDSRAHIMEHSLEVQLPFIRAVNRNASVTPVTVMHASLRECEEMGRAMASVISGAKKDILIVVSSDMNHYESDRVTRGKDKLAIDKVLKLDAEGLLGVAEEKGISMCGVIPAAIAISAAKRLGAKEGRLVKYATSGDTSGDYDQVVGYAGIVIK